MKRLLRRRRALGLMGGWAALAVLRKLQASPASPASSVVAPLTVLFEPLAPVSYLDPGGQPAGFLIEMISEMCRRAGLPCQFEAGSWARSEARAQEEPNLLLASVARLAERENRYYWIGPTLQRRAHLYRLSARSDLRLNKLDDARHYLIGVIRDDVSQRELLAQGFVLDQQLDPSPDVESLMRKLFAGRNDLVALSAATVPDILRRTGHESGQIEAAFSLSVTPLFQALSRSSGVALRDRLASALATMRRDGWLAHLQARYPEIPLA